MSPSNVRSQQNKTQVGGMSIEKDGGSTTPKDGNVFVSPFPPNSEKPGVSSDVKQPIHRFKTPFADPQRPNIMNDDSLTRAEQLVAADMQ